MKARSNTYCPAVPIRGDDWKPRHLDTICTREVGLDGLPEVFATMLGGGSFGRTLVRID